MQQVLWRIPIKTGLFPDGIPIYGFGMMLFVSFLVCTWLAGRRAQRAGIAKEFIQDLAIWIFVGGLLGARLTYLSNETTWPSLGELGFGKWLREVLGILGDMVLRLPRIWDGGIILYGSVVGALAGYGVGYFLVFRKYKLSTLKLADVVAPTIAVGMAMGRLGSLRNWPRGESLVTLSVYHEGDDPRAGGPVRITFRPRTLGLYPTQPYEVVSMVLLFLLLLAYEPFRRHDGQVMAVLMMGYALHRYLNEILRDDPRPESFVRYSSAMLS